jgi:photosystem II stability/assembly factor-like uncharacterized protein
MGSRVLILVGTRKGAFILESDARRGDWVQRGPYCETWPINHLKADRATGTIYGAGGNEWFGPAVWKSTDLGRTWTHSSDGLAYPTDETPIRAAWSVEACGETVHAGVEPAGLFRSDDGGGSWRHLSALRDHPSRPHWQPGGGGLILHTLVPHPEDDRQLWVGISAAGVFHTADAGASWEARNRGTRCDYLPEEQRYPETGQCVHNLVMATGRPERLYQQNHCGMYRSDDGGRSWTSIEAGLPSTFGFASAVHPQDPDGLYLMPLNGDSIGRYPPDARAAVWRTRDAGASWQDLREGLPQQGAYFAVLRQALATDALEPAGIYFGTNGGSVFASANEGDSWREVARHLPTVVSVETLVVNG